MKPRHAFLLLLLLAVVPMFGGCGQRNLFADSDPAEKKLKYWGDDSAVKSHKNRDQANEWGFGTPGGMGFQ